jgi:hypothetical protein
MNGVAMITQEQLIDRATRQGYCKYLSITADGKLAGMKF